MKDELPLPASPDLLGLVERAVRDASHYLRQAYEEAAAGLAAEQAARDANLARRYSVTPEELKRIEELERRIVALRKESSRANLEVVERRRQKTRWRELGVQLDQELRGMGPGEAPQALTRALALVAARLEEEDVALQLAEERADLVMEENGRRAQSLARERDRRVRFGKSALETVDPAARERVAAAAWADGRFRSCFDAYQRAAVAARSEPTEALRRRVFLDLYAELLEKAGCRYGRLDVVARQKSDHWWAYLLFTLDNGPRLAEDGSPLGPDRLFALPGR